MVGKQARANVRAAEVAAERLQAVQRPNVVDEVVERMMALIAELQPGDRIPAERRLVQQLGVGRTSMREAIRVLLSLGLLEVRGGRGTFVSQDDTPFLSQALMVSAFVGGRTAREVHEMRTLMEPQIARLATQRATQDDLDRIRATLDAQAAALDSIDRFLQADVAFHMAIAQAAHNRVFYQMLRAVRTLMMTRLGTTLAAQPASVLRDRYLEHKAIYDAIVDRDEEGAVQAMLQHQRAFRHLVISDEDDALGPDARLAEASDATVAGG